MQAKNWMLTLVGAVLILAATAAAYNHRNDNWLAMDGSPTRAASPAPAVTGALTAPAVPAAPVQPGTTPNFRAIVQQAAPAVVGVTVAGQHAVGADQMAPDMNDPFFEFFRGLPGFQLRIPRPGQGGNVPFRSQGSGFIIASDGLILTNAHVVREAKEVTVKLSDRREFRARVLGADAATDIAVLRIDAKNLPVVRLGDSQQLQVGDPVLAIGSPFGFEQSATQGIVSAKGRSLPGDAAVPFIQTDAAVNPGNSGGPLFDASGAVVGINAQIYSQSGGFQGLSFAIPISVALKVKDQILASGHAEHARLGVSVQDLTQGLASSFGLSQPDGALVAGVDPKSAAADAGLQPGDVITEVNGEAVQRSGDLSSRIGQALPGETVRLKVWRDGAAKMLTVKLGRAQEPGNSTASTAEHTGPGGLGLRLRPLTRDELNATQLKAGLLIEGVQGPAASAGVQPGDVLLAINGVATSSTDQVRRVMDKKPKQVALLLWHDGNRIFVPVELE
ncbi:peptidase [Rhodoferax lacus]|uniref:Probable periplasmic serine endoprotease DegP-like n=1 Tax=Rhodoferax lacus TaxID=2184758 RepID=A0A3E1REJ2_9BURK|nr:Do family serine endopeptidase [Rhodoferax lacus]RFO97452.1 peptidase [Rhodoferax lacus]